MEDLPALRTLRDARADIEDGGHHGFTLLQAADPTDAYFVFSIRTAMRLPFSAVPYLNRAPFQAYPPKPKAAFNKDLSTAYS